MIVESRAGSAPASIRSAAANELSMSRAGPVSPAWRKSMQSCLNPSVSGLQQTWLHSDQYRSRMLRGNCCSQRGQVNIDPPPGPPRRGVCSAISAGYDVCSQQPASPSVLTGIARQLARICSAVPVEAFSCRGRGNIAAIGRHATVVGFSTDTALTDALARLDRSGFHLRTGGRARSTVGVAPLDLASRGPGAERPAASTGPRARARRRGSPTSWFRVRAGPPGRRRVPRSRSRSRGWRRPSPGRRVGVGAEPPLHEAPPG